jgi:hypothetical protein
VLVATDVVETVEESGDPAQSALGEADAQLAGLSDREAAQVTWQNAAYLFRHAVPVEVQRDPNAF